MLQVPQLGAPQMSPVVLRTQAVESVSVELVVLQVPEPQVSDVTLRVRAPLLMHSPG